MIRKGDDDQAVVSLCDMSLDIYGFVCELLPVRSAFPGFIEISFREYTFWLGAKKYKV